MLEKMGLGEVGEFEGHRIFDVELNKDKKKINFTEACDSYYSVDLSKQEFIELIKDLQLIADEMIE